MKKVKLYAMAFAAMFFAASCQDDAIDPGQGQGNGTDGTPAYLTLSFTANGGSSTRSTADDANNQGDKDGDAEDSGHSNAGTTNENAVDGILVVITPDGGGNVNYARYYNVAASGSTTDDADHFESSVTAGSTTYTNNNPIELTTGRYNVAVVVNPSLVDLLTGVTGDINAGIENSNEVENLYAKITTGQYTPTEENFKKLAAGQAFEDAYQFRMPMASQNLNSEKPTQTYSIELTTEDTPEEPATLKVDVERTYSKITFRETSSNIYKVPVYVGEVEARLVDAAIAKNDLSVAETAEEEGEVTYEYRQLNAALDYAGHEVYVLWEAASEDATPEFKGVFGKTKETVEELTVGEETKTDVVIYKKLTAITDASQYVEGANYVIETADDYDSGLTLVSDEVSPAKEWFVKLEGYALVNLSKSVYYVRHTTDAMGQSPFGQLNGSNFLYTPWWSEKNDDNNITEGTDGNPVFKTENGNPISEKWFYNTLAQVSGESKSLTIDASGAFKNGTADASYYRAMPTGDDQGQVFGDGEQHNATDNTLPNVGKFMSYCFENSTDVEHQIHGISTGISFVARIYANQECTNKIETLYRYNNHLFESLEAIQKSYGANMMSKKFNDLVNKEEITEGKTNITKADLQELAEFKKGGSTTSTVGLDRDGEQIDMYADGICYYYTTEIKHFDNGDNASLGNMEFAIMRNNIYSLAVTDINEIGDPFVDPTPDKPNENPEVKTALNVEVKIVPWIVRYNDIEF